MTNLENSAQPFVLRATHPGTIPLQSLTVPSALVDGFVNAVVSQIRVHLTHGVNASFVTFPPNVSAQDVHFTVPDFQRTIDLFLVQFTIVEFVDDVNTDALTLRCRTRHSGPRTAACGWWRPSRKRVGKSAARSRPS